MKLTIEPRSTSDSSDLVLKNNGAPPVEHIVTRMVIVRVAVAATLQFAALLLISA